MKKPRGNTLEESILIEDSSSSDESPSPRTTTRQITTRSKGKERQQQGSDKVVRKKAVRFTTQPASPSGEEHAEASDKRISAWYVAQYHIFCVQECSHSIILH